MFKTLLVFTLITALNTLTAQDFVIDGSHTSAGFSIKHMGISTVLGSFAETKGTFSMKDGKLTALEATIPISSVNTNNAKRDKHLQQDDFFNAAKHPVMTFKMTSYKGDAKKGKMTGDLTIMGTTRRIQLDVEIGGVIKDPWGNTRAGFSMRGQIDRTKFGMASSKMIGDIVNLNCGCEGIVKK